MKIRIKTYYCNINNFGDSLNRLIYDKFIKVKIKYTNIPDAELIGIGSLLDNCLMDKHGFYKKDYPLIVFSTGFGFEEGGCFHNPSIILPEKLNRDIIPFAVRGYLTLERIKKLTNSNCKNVVVGDGGLLSNYFVKKDKIKKRYRLGIIPHYADSDNLVFQKINENIKDSTIIDITEDPILFLQHICECETVISSAMHGLIACDSLNIPNMWVRISETTTSRYKFHDYYSALNTDKEPFDLLNNTFDNNTVQSIIDTYSIDYQLIQNIQLKLIEQLNNIKSMLIKNRINSIKKIFSIFNWHK